MGVKQKPLILIADDSELNREILAEMLGDGFDVLYAADGIETVEILKKKHEEISLLLLDINMPKLDGFGVLYEMQQEKWSENVPVIMVTAETDETYLAKAYEMGVTDYIRRPFSTHVVQRRVMNTIKLYEKQKRLEETVMNQIYEQQKSNMVMINILSHVVEFRNGESGMHVIHIQSFTKLILNHLVKNMHRIIMSDNEIDLICIASALHDVGKIAIPDSILNKPGRFTDEEFAIMKTHSAVGDEILSQVTKFQDEPLLKTARQIARWHHERYDGRGYPDGIKGNEIPIGAQVVALADVYDALTSERCYKKAFTHEKAIEMILNGECGAFNPVLLECLKELDTQIQHALEEDIFERDEKELRKKLRELV